MKVYALISVQIWIFKSKIRIPLALNIAFTFEFDSPLMFALNAKRGRFGRYFKIYFP